MPELPEVETVRLGLLRHVKGWNIHAVDTNHPRAVNPRSISTLKQLSGSKIVDIKRRGKFLWFELDKPFVMSAHLGMSGQFLIDPVQTKHSRAVIYLKKAGKEHALHFNDQRTFGWLSIEQLIDGVPTSVFKIAPDVFEASFDIDSVAKLISKRNIKIKTAILNQEIVSGIGNIYADESLWLAKIHPNQIANTLSVKEIRNLLRCAQKVMSKALSVGGTSFDSMYVNVNGESGYFENKLKAYGREGEPCKRCHGAISRIKFAGRSSHLCGNCQLEN